MTIAPALEACALTKSFRHPGGGPALRRRVPVIEDVSLALEAAQTLGLVGESGSGKSTLASMLIGDFPPSGGEARLFGRDPRTLARRARARLVQPIVQDPRASLDPRWRIGALMNEPLRIHAEANVSNGDDRVAAALSAVELPPDVIERYPHQVSGGQAQRLAIARALLLEPRLLVCDEPLSALDLVTQDSMIALLRRLRAERAMSMLFISHDLHAVRALSDMIAVLYLGRLVEIGPAAAIGGPSSHPYTRALVAAAPRFATARRPRQRATVDGEPPSHAAKPSGCVFHPRCPLAIPVCKSVRPPAVRLQDGHSVACHLAQPHPAMVAT